MAVRTSVTKLVNHTNITFDTQHMALVPPLRRPLLPEGLCPCSGGTSFRNVFDLTAHCNSRLLLVSLLSLFVALSLGEIASKYPTSAGAYYWCYRLAPPRHRLLISYITGWLTVTGDWMVSLSVTFVCAVVACIVAWYSSSSRGRRSFSSRASTYTILNGKQPHGKPVRGALRKCSLSHTTA